MIGVNGKIYIPYDTLKKACRQIKASYTQPGKESGYANYMKYWARNGDYNQICDYSENKGNPGKITQVGGTVRVNNTYLASNFWNHYDGTKDPVTGQVRKDEKGDVKKANGWS